MKPHANQHQSARKRSPRSGLVQQDGAANGSQPFSSHEKAEAIGGWPRSLTSAFAEMTFALKITLATVALAALIALAASRLTVAHVLVGNPTALAASSVEQALHKYESEHGHYPPLDFDLDNLAAATNSGPYLSGPARDAWHHPYRYTLVNGKPRVYSAGPDGIFDTKDDIYAGGLTCKTRYVFR